MTIREQFLAALACSAVADAVGNDFEFQHGILRSEVKKAIHEQHRIGITDDSQMTYFGMRALYTKLVYPNQHFKFLIRDEYMNWYRTQLGDMKGSIKLMTGGPVPDVFFKRRCPGVACMTSMGQLNAYNKRPMNTSRGCGSVMRLLPFVSGLVDDQKGLEYSLLSAAVTHDHPDSKEAVALYNAVARMYRADLDPAASIDLPERILKAKKISNLGSGFYAKEAVDMAIWAVENSFDYEQLLINSICHDGDSDSVGAIAGGLWGLLHKEMPPKAWLDRVEEWPAIEKEALELLALTGN